MFRYVNWSKLLTLNISTDFLIPETLIYQYIEETNEIFLEFDYRENLENLLARATLSFSLNAVQSAQIKLNDFQLVSAAKTPSQPTIFSIPPSLSLDIKINGVNAILSAEDEAILLAYKASSIGFTVITIVILIEFLIGSYFHKMIGLETIQILQFFYFITMIVDLKTTSFLKSLNILKYTAYGGYSDY